MKIKIMSESDRIGKKIDKLEKQLEEEIKREKLKQKQKEVKEVKKESKQEEPKKIDQEFIMPEEIKKLNSGQKLDRLMELFLQQDGTDIPMDEKLNRILGFIEKKKIKGKSKNFKLPGKVKSSIKNFHKKNKILVVYIKENKSMDFTTTEIFKGMVFIDGDWQSVPEQAIFMYKNKFPVIILPAWDLQALIPDELYADAVKEKRLVAPQTIIIRAMKLEQSKMKAGNMLAGKGIIWLIIGAGILLYMFFG